MVSYHNDNGILEVRHRHEVIRIQAWGADSVRVRAAQYRDPGRQRRARSATPRQTAPTSDGHTMDGTRAALANGRLRVEVTFDTAESYPEPLITFRDPDGAELLAESREHFWMPGARVFAGNRSGAYEIHQQFAAYPGERLYGLGQRTHGRLNLKGLALDLVQRNGEVSIPFVLSDRGYGLLWNSPAVGRVEFAENATRWQAGQAREIDYWFTAAPTPAEILARYADATGHAPELPAWASGFWQSKLRYRTQDELLEVAREYKRRGLPLSVIVADFFHWSAMGDYRFDPAEWPDPDAMVAELRELGVELMVSIWPTVSPLSENYAEFSDQGLLVGADQGVEFQQTIQDKGMAAPMPVAFYDPTNPADPRVRLEPGGAQLPVPRHPRLLARRLRAGAQSGPPRQPVPVRRARRGGRRHLPARQRPAVRRGHGRRRAGADRPAVPLGLGRIAAVRRGGLVRGHPGHLGVAARCRSAPA